MKKISEKQIILSKGYVESNNHMSNCIAAEICPACGSDIFINQDEIDKSPIRTTFYECSTCEWKNYEYAEHCL